MGDGGQRRGRCRRRGAEGGREARLGRDVRGCIPQCFELPAAFRLPGAGGGLAQIPLFHPSPPHPGSAPAGPGEGLGEKGSIPGPGGRCRPHRGQRRRRGAEPGSRRCSAQRWRGRRGWRSAEPRRGMKVAPANPCRGGIPTSARITRGVKIRCRRGRKGKEEAAGSEPGLGAMAPVRFVLRSREKPFPSRSAGFPRAVRPFGSEGRPESPLFVLNFPPEDRLEWRGANRIPPGIGRDGFCRGFLWVGRAGKE